MLAKIWKKLFLVICIIAILFNITIKLVNRISLEKAISSTPDGVNLKKILNITDEPKTINQVDNVSKYKTVEEVEAEKAAKEAAIQKVEEQDEQVVEEQFQEEQEEKSTGGKIIDKVTESITNVKKYDNLLN